MCQHDMQRSMVQSSVLGAAGVVHQGKPGLTAGIGVCQTTMQLVFRMLALW